MGRTKRFKLGPLVFIGGRGYFGDSGFLAEVSIRGRGIWLAKTGGRYELGIDVGTEHFIRVGTL